MKYKAHDYQQYATDFIIGHPVSCLILDMGLGKTVISLTAIADLLFDSFMAHRVLVVAPLRVARDTWPAEIEKWAHLKELTYTVAVGSARERRAALMVSADITIINRENLSWLIESSGFSFDYDTVVIDELSSFKNHQSKRFKALLRVRPKVKRIIGLTPRPPTASWICGPSSGCWIWVSASDASSHSIGTPSSSLTNATDKSSTPTSPCRERRTPSTAGFRTSRFP